MKRALPPVRHAPTALGARGPRLAAAAAGTFAVLVALWRGRVAAAAPLAGLDLAPLYAAGKAAAGGRSVYPTGAIGSVAFVYPPPAALLGRLLDLVPLATLEHVWAFGEAFVVVGCVTLVWSQLSTSPWRLAQGLLLGCAALTSTVGEYSLWLENVSLLALPVLVLMSWSYANRRWTGGVTAWALSLTIKPLLLPLLVLPVLARRRRAVLFGVLPALAVLLLALATVPGSDQLVRVARHVLGGAGVSGAGVRYNESLAGFGETYHLPRTAVTLARGVVVASAVVAFATAVLRARTPATPDAEPLARRVLLATVLRTAGLALVTVLLAGSLGEIHYLVPLLAPLLAVLVEWRRLAPAHRGLALAAAALFGFSSHYALGYGSGDAAVQAQAVAAQLTLFAALLLLFVQRDAAVWRQLALSVPAPVASAPVPTTPAPDPITSAPVPTTPAPPPSRIAALDGLRGVAAMVVVLHHVLLTDPALAEPYARGAHTPMWTGVQAWLLYSPLHLLWDGPEAVMVFFVLSGYVLAVPAARGGRTRWAAYYAKRLPRLYLPTWAATALALASIALVPRHVVEGASWWMNHHVTPSIGAVAQDLSLTGKPGATNVPLWSLEWEVLFSLLLPLFVLLAARLAASSRRAATSRRAAALAGLLVVMLAGGATNHSAVLLLPMFGVGVLLAHSEDLLDVLSTHLSGRGGHSGRTLGWSLALLCVVLLEGSWAISVATGWSTPGKLVAAQHLFEVLGAALAVVLARCWPPAGRRLRGPTASWLGRRSYSLYLVHEPIVVTTVLLLGGRPPLLVVLGVAVPIAVGASAVFHRLVERPSLALANRCAGWVNGRTAVPAGEHRAASVAAR